MCSIDIYVSYSRKDAIEKEHLITHLSILEFLGLAKIWDQSRLDSINSWLSELDRISNEAGIAIPLITEHYLSADINYRSEVEQLLDRSRNGNLMILPVIAKNCHWQKIDWLTELEVRPKSGQPVWRDDGRYADEELLTIIEEILMYLAPDSPLLTLQNAPLKSLPKRGPTRPVALKKARTSDRGEIMDYENALDVLKAQVEQTNRYVHFVTLEARLRENLQDEYLYGSNEANRSERARIINSLNKFALDTLNISFNDLALKRTPEASEISSYDLSLVKVLQVATTSTEIIPPVQTKLIDLPFNELSWEQFEALCAALIEVQPITIDCHLYGVQGDDQQGIDIVTSQRGISGNIEAWAYQCKRYKEYTPGKIKEAIKKMTYPADYYVVMLSIPATAAVRKVSDEQSNIYLWDAKDISRKLKNYPKIVEDFFGRAWREAFCV